MPFSLAAAGRLSHAANANVWPTVILRPLAAAPPPRYWVVVPGWLTLQGRPRDWTTEVVRAANFHPTLPPRGTPFRGAGPGPPQGKLAGRQSRPCQTSNTNRADLANRLLHLLDSRPPRPGRSVPRTARGRESQRHSAKAHRRPGYR